MSPEPPPSPPRRSRPDADFRRRALGVARPGEVTSANPRESFRNALARIPDLERAADGTPVVVPVVRPVEDAAPKRSAGAEPASGSPEVLVVAPPTQPTDIVVDPSPSPSAPPVASAAGAATAVAVGVAVVDTPEAPAEPVVPEAPDKVPEAVIEPTTPALIPPVTRKASRAVELPVLEASTLPVTSRRGPNVPRPPAEVPATHHGRRVPSPPPPPPWWRRVAFGLTLALLVVAIPLLGRAGYRIVTESTSGQAGATGAKPGEPGYEELVVSTPTAVVLQKDAVGMPVGLTFLSLSNGDEGGGSVVFVPLDTKVTKPAYGVDRLRSSYTVVANDPAGATNQIADQTAKVLGVGVDEVIALDDRGWDQLVAPVAPLTFDNPEPIDTPTGTVAAGVTQMTAAQMGPYLAAQRFSDAEDSAFIRQEAAWRAWLEAIKGSDRPDAVPGETATGIGHFARTLAAGPVTFHTLPGLYELGEDNVNRFVPDAGAVTDLMVDVVPAPDSPFPGGRTTVRVLNGVGPGAIPATVLRDVSALNGSVTVVGNAPAFGQKETTIIYADPAKADYATLLAARLGIQGQTKLDRNAPDTVEVTVVLGEDVLGSSASAAVTTSTVVPTSGSIPSDPGITTTSGGF